MSDGAPFYLLNFESCAYIKFSKSKQTSGKFLNKTQSHNYLSPTGKA